MKNLFIKQGKWALIAALTLLLAACGGQNPPADTPAPETPPRAEEPAQQPLPPPQNAPETAPPATGRDRPSETETQEELQQTTLLRSVLAYPRQDGDSRELEAGTEVLIQKEENGEWMRCVADGETLWLHLNPENAFMVETPSGWLYLWVALDGLDFAN